MNTVLSQVPDALLCPVVFPPELGAVIHLFRKESLLNAQVLENIKSTSKEIYP